MTNNDYRDRLTAKLTTILDGNVYKEGYTDKIPAENFCVLSDETFLPL